MKTKLLATIFLLQSVLIFAGGLLAWSEKTPNGHILYFDGSAGSEVEIELPQKTIYFKDFYFYRDHIIASSDSHYYIINDKEFTFQEFTNENLWNDAIVKQELKPFWKRSFYTHYGFRFSDRGLLFQSDSFLPMPSVFLWLWLICGLSLLFKSKRFWTIRKYYTVLYPALVFLVWLYDEFPQSF